MDLINICDLSDNLDISSRTLRYYEQVGILESKRFNGKQQRFYDEKAIERIKQILILRKMQISIKDIVKIYKSSDMTVLIETFTNKINSIDDDISSLYELRKIVDDFLQKMIANGINTISAIPLLYEETEKRLNENKPQSDPVSLKSLNDVSNKLNKLTDVRIEQLEPMRVLSSYIKESDRNSGTKVCPEKWAQVNKNLKQAPRGYFEFTNPHHSDQMVEIYKISEEYINKTEFEDFIFEGGLFAITVAYAPEIGEKWQLLKKWINESEYFEPESISNGGNRAEIYGNPLTPEAVHKLLGDTPEYFQWDLLIPVKIKK
jgi:DNA-binding transcriptional MerR regulator